MFAIYLKELNSFFSSLIGYIAIGVFLCLMGVFVWIFPDTNVLDFGYADLRLMFDIAPMILMVLIPAITMRSFAEETSLGTIETLATRPLKESDIVLGKYLACLTLVLFAILPTLVYYWSVIRLGSPIGNIDHAAFWGSFIGLLLLSGVFVAMGVFASSIVNAQFVAFVVGMMICSFSYMGFQWFSTLTIGKGDFFLEKLGMSYHFEALARGVVELRDVVYFLSLIVAFLLFTYTSLEKRKW